MTRRYYGGHIQDQHNGLKHGDTLVGVPSMSALPLHVHLESPALPIFNQGSTESCVGHATSSGIHITIHNMYPTMVNPIISPVGIYTIGRCLVRNVSANGHLTALVDTGSMPNWCMRGLTEVGVNPVNIWGNFPANPTTVNNEPNVDQLESSSAYKLKTFQRFSGTGDILSMQLMGTLAKGHAFTFATYVDNEFENYTNGIIGAPDKKNLLGSHYLCCDGYEWDGRDLKSVVWRFRNSWDISWGEGGRGRGNRAFFDALAGDFYALGVT